MSSSSPLSPTFYGHIASTQDALLLFESCLSGALNHVARRPHDRERSSLIKSGNVFIYEEHSSGIKRWTDGVPWSPSRILGNFLVYRELERPFPPGEKKKAMKRTKRSPGISKAPEIYGGHGISNGYNVSPRNSSFDQGSTTVSLSKETERSLIGSLVDSYGFKEEGLVKKTVSVTVGGVSHHLVSYYTVADVMSNKFSTPSKDPRFQHINPRAELVTKQNFRTPIDEVDTMDRMDDRSVYSAYAYTRNGYDMTNQTLSHRPLSLPTPTIPSYAQSPAVFSNYGVNNPAVYGDTYASGSPNHGYHGQIVPTIGVFPPSRTDNHGGYHNRQQRYNSVVGTSDMGRGPMSGVGSDWPSRRISSYGQNLSIDSAISTSSSDSKVSNDSGYASQGYYGNPRDMSHQSLSYRKMSLPTPTLQTTYDRATTQPFTNMENSDVRESMWQMGTASNDHGHYLSPQHPLSPHSHWTSTETS
jgi:hypothetical protein